MTKASQDVWETVGASSDAPEVVTGKTRRGKRKQKKLQKVDPSILGTLVHCSQHVSLTLYLT